MKNHVHLLRKTKEMMLLLLLLFAKACVQNINVLFNNETNKQKVVSHCVRVCKLDIFFSSNHNIHKSSHGLCFGLQTLWLLDFTKIYQLKGLKSKNNGCTNFYECCDLTEKVYLV